MNAEFHCSDNNFFKLFMLNNEPVQQELNT
jgi:hypothetical protein